MASTASGELPSPSSPPPPPPPPPPPLSLLLSPLSTFPTSAKEVEHYIAVVAAIEGRMLNANAADDDDGNGREHASFFRALAILVSDFLTAGCDLLHSAAQFQSLHRAVRILTDYVAAEIAAEPATAASSSVVVPARDLLHAFSAFCSGTPSLDKSEQAHLVQVLGGATKPDFITLVSSAVDIEELDDGASASQSDSATTPTSVAAGDPNRPQTDLTVLLLDQFLTPIDKDVTLSSGGGGAADAGNAGVAAGANQGPDASTPRLSSSKVDVERSNATTTDYGNRARLVRSSFAAKNVQYMHRRNVGDALVELCSCQTHLKTFIGQWNSATAGSDEGISSVPASFAEAAAHRQTYGELVLEISTTWRALTIPVLEPLTSDRLAKVCQVVMGCLLASVSVATTQSILGLQSSSGGGGSLSSSGGSGAGAPVIRSNSTGKKEDEELDMQAVEIIEKSLELLNSMLSLVRESTRAGGHVLQNFATMSAWVLITGMVVQFTKTSNVAESIGSKREEQAKINLPKAQQGFGVLSVALASQALTLTASLLDDLSTEISEEGSNKDEESGTWKVEPANFDLFFPFTATQRVALIFDSVPFIQLLFNMASISYKKSCSLKHLLCKVQQKAAGALAPKDRKKVGEAVIGEKRAPTVSLDEIEEDSYSDEDEYAPAESSHDDDDDDDDDDSEPLLGKWFEETLLPQGEMKAAASGSAADRNGDQTILTTAELVPVDPSNGLHVPDKGEPAGFISLASHIFIFMNKHLLATHSAYVKDYVASRLSEQQMAVLGAIIQDLDHDATNSAGLKLEYHLASLYSEFSAALSSFTHNLLAHGLLTTKLQNSLLSHLSVSPWQSAATTEEGDHWPLRVFPRTLAVLAQILLLRQNQEGAGGLYASKQTNVYIVIWGKVLASLTRLIQEPPAHVAGVEDGQIEDMNVEHVQLLLFLFHALALMQKKQVLLMTASSIHKISGVVTADKKLQTSQILHISRLVLFFEYLMRNLYEPPKELMEQVQTNIFKRYQNTSVLSSAPPSHFPFKTRDSKSPFASALGALEQMCVKPRSASPRYYNLFSVTDVPSVQEIPKLDGLACSFLLGTSDSLHYGQIYDSLIRVLGVIHQADHWTIDSDSDESIEGLAATQYCFTIVWRLLQSLPPSVEFLESLVGPQSEMGKTATTPCMLLHTLILCPRTGHKVLSAWIKDSLVKQGQTTAKAENLLKNVSTTINQLSYDVRMFQNYISGLKCAKGPEGMGGQTRRKLPPASDMPSFVDLLLFDAVLAKVQISTDMLLNCKPSDVSNADGVSSADRLPEAVEAMRQLGPILTGLISSFTFIAKSFIVQNIGSSEKGAKELDDFSKSALLQLLAISGSYLPTTNKVIFAMNNSFPSGLLGSMQDWNEAAILDFPPTSSWRSSSASATVSGTVPPIELLPYEVYINLLIRTHTASLTGPLRRKLKSLKHCLYSTVRFAEDLYVACGSDMPDLRAKLSSALFPVLMDASTETWADLTTLTLQSPATGATGPDKLAAWTYTHFLESTFDVLLDAGELIRAGCFDEKLVRQIVQFMESMLEEPEGREALDKFFNGRDEFLLIKILLTSASPELSPEYASKVLTFFNRLFETSEKTPDEGSAANLCSSLAGLAKIPSSQLELWLSRLVQGIVHEHMQYHISFFPLITGTLDGSKKLEPDMMAAVYDNRALLQSLSRYIVREEAGIPEDVALAILKCLLPMGESALNPAVTEAGTTVEGLGFGDLMAVMKTLAGSGTGVGHVQLFRECSRWLDTCKTYIAQKNVLEKLENGIGAGKHVTIVENACQLLNYVRNSALNLKLKYN